MALFCGGCAEPDQESVRTVAAIEIPLDTAVGRNSLVSILRRHVTPKSGLHVDDVTQRWREFEAGSNTVVPAERGTIFVGVWRGRNDNELIADVGDTGHPGRVWLTFVRGQHTAVATAFRNAVIAEIKAKWPEAKTLPVLPSGGLPLLRDLQLTSTGYRIRRAAAAVYELTPDSPLLTQAN